MILFWLTFMGFSAYIAIVYIPMMGKLLSLLHLSFLADVVIWSTVVVILVFVLLLFRDFLHELFWKQIRNGQRFKID